MMLSILLILSIFSIVYNRSSVATDILCSLRSSSGYPEVTDRKCDPLFNNDFTVYPTDPNGIHGGISLGIASAGMAGVMNNLLELAKNELSRLVIPGPIKTTLDLLIFKLNLIFSNIAVDTLDFNSGIVVRFPQTKGDYVGARCDKVSVIITMDYQALSGMPPIELAGVITASAVFSLDLTLNAYVQGPDECANRIKFGQGSEVTIVFSTLNIKISGADFLNAFLALLSDLLKSLLNQILRDLLTDLLITGVNNNLGYERATEAMDVPYPSSSRRYIGADNRYAEVKSSSVALIMDYTGYIIDINHLKERYIPKNIVQTPNSMMPVKDVKYTFGSEVYQSMFYQYGIDGMYNYVLTFNTNASHPPGNPDFVFPDEYKTMLFDFSNPDNTIAKILPELRNLYDSATKITIETKYKDISVEKFGPVGILLDFKYEVTLKYGAKVLIVLDVDNSKFVGQPDLRLKEYKDNNQIYYRGFFYLRYINYRIPTVSIVQNPDNLNFSTNKNDIDYYFYMLQEMMQSNLTTGSYNGLCLQRKIVLFVENAKKTGFLMKQNSVEFWEDL